MFQEVLGTLCVTHQPKQASRAARRCSIVPLAYLASVRMDELSTVQLPVLSSVFASVSCGCSLQALVMEMLSPLRDLYSGDNGSAGH